MSIRLLFAYHPCIQQAGISRLLRQLDDVELHEAFDADETLRLTLRVRPHVVLSELALRGIAPLALPAQLRAIEAEVPVLTLSPRADVELAAEALRSGASGFVWEGCETADLAHALRKCAAGEQRVCSGVDGTLLERLLPKRSPLELLSARQRAVLGLMATGRSMKEVAFTLSLSVKTVEAHRAAIRRRLGNASLADMTRLAMRHGLVD